MGKHCLIVGAAALLLSLPAICGAEPGPVDTTNRVRGEKLDSGLGGLPPYAQWAKHPTLHVFMRPAAAHRVSGEKLDSGLGGLPPYVQWAKHPTLHEFMRPAAAHSVSGEKLDSGLGDLHAASGLR